MKKAISDLQRLRQHAPAMHGVFALPDLAALMAEPHPHELYRRIRRLEGAQVLSRFARGVYTTEGYSPRALIQRLRPDSYISFGTVLADARLIGSVPKFQIDAIALGRSKTFTANGMTLRYFGIRKDMYFGFEVRDGVSIATPEKALLDTLYFHQHGARFFFDVFSDINVSPLNLKRLDSFLRCYKNPRFKVFVKEYLNEHGLAKRR